MSAPLQYTDNRGDNRLVAYSDPAYDGFAITPHASNYLSRVTRGIYIGGGDGTLSLETAAGTTLSFVGLAIGSVLPIQARKVFVSGTGSTGLIGLV
jgi:hypothetical protein